MSSRVIPIIFEEQDLSLSSGIFHVDRTQSLIEGHGKVWKTHNQFFLAAEKYIYTGGGLYKSFLYRISVSFVIFNKQHQHGSLSTLFSNRNII